MGDEMTTHLDALDKLCAEKIMGWQLTDYSDCGHGLLWMIGAEDLMRDYDWQPTRRIEQAWECLDKFIKNAPKVEYEVAEKIWHCILWSATSFDSCHEATAPTAPEAIVRACLKAKGVEIG